MIISLRGASGSGKSTLTRRITAMYDSDHEPIYVDGRRRAYYTVHRRSAGRSLLVPGHYDIANGGMDTLDDLDEIYGMALNADSDGHDVLMEGKCMTDGRRHALRLHEQLRSDFRVVHIDLPLRSCVGAVRQRGHHIAEHSIARTREKILRDVGHLRACGVSVFQGNRAECLETVKRYLGLEEGRACSDQFSSE